MKRHVRTAIAIMFICGVLAVGVEAQTFGSQTIRANIPFAFNVGQQRLPAGVYTVSILNPTSDRTALQIRSADGKANAIVQTVGASKCLAGSNLDDAKLVFRRYGDRYFFAEAQLAGDSTSLTATRTRAERSAQEALKRRGNMTLVTVAAR
ncbi:MAG TPA: hypothetical protein VJT15_10660 [Pyrinomonadaceae bacterium]|nr:hypothetical protein [Pyrinomonadaceae bacterium]